MNAGAVPGAAEPLTVLVVDDDPDFLAVIAYALRRIGIRVLAAAGLRGRGPRFPAIARH